MLVAGLEMAEEEATVRDPLSVGRNHALQGHLLNVSRQSREAHTQYSFASVSQKTFT